MSDAVTVTFTPTFLDTVRALRDVGSTLRWVRWLRRTGLVLPPLGVALALAAPRALPLAVLLLLLGAFLLLLGLLTPVLGAWKARYESPTARAEHVVAIDGGGILTAAGPGRNFLAWPDVVRVSETRRFFLIHTSAQAASFLPKHAFAAPADLEAVRTLAADRAGRPADPARAGAAPRDDLGAVRVEAVFRSGVLERFQEAHELRRHGSLRWTWVLFFALVAAALLLPIQREWRAGAGVDWLAHLLGAAPLVLAIALGYPLLLLWAAWSQSRTSRLVGQEQRVRIGERGLGAEGPFSAASMRWEALARVVETRRFFLFYLSGESGFVLPKRALTPEQVAASREFLGAKLGFNFLQKDRAAAVPTRGAIGAASS